MNWRRCDIRLLLYPCHAASTKPVCYFPEYFPQMPTQFVSRYPLKRTRSGTFDGRMDSFGWMPPDSSMPYPPGPPLAMSMPYSPGAPLATVKSSGGYHSAMKTRNGTMPKEKRDTSEVSPRKRKSRRVRFNTVVKLFLVPARSDLGSLVLDLWWQREDYLMFRSVRS